MEVVVYDEEDCLERHVFWLFQKHSFQVSFENGKMGALTKMGFYGDFVPYSRLVLEGSYCVLILKSWAVWERKTHQYLVLHLHFTEA